MNYCGGNIIIEIENNEIELDEVCYQCMARNPYCKYCKGVGYILTKAGESIIELIKRHGIK